MHKHLKSDKFTCQLSVVSLVSFVPQLASKMVIRNSPSLSSLSPFDDFQGTYPGLYLFFVWLNYAEMLITFVALSSR